MSLVIDDPEVVAMVKKLQGATGETATQIVGRAVKAEISKLPPAEIIEKRRAALKRFHEAMSKLPILDDRSADEIIGYNEHGMFD